jgi:hypothetical protein
MIGMLLTKVYYSKVVNNQCELYRPCVVFLKAGYQFALSVSVFVQSFFKEFVRQ